MQLSSLITFEELNNFFNSLEENEVDNVYDYDDLDLDKALSRYYDLVDDLANAKVTEKLQKFLGRFPQFENIQECLIQICEYHKEVANEVEDILEFSGEAFDKVYSNQRNFRIFTENCYGFEEDNKDFEKAFYRFFMEKLKELKVSKKDLNAIICKEFSLYACDNNMYGGENIENHFDEKIAAIQKAYGSSDKIELEQSELDELKSSVCNALKIDQEIFNNFLKLNCFVNDFDHSNSVFHEFDDNQKLELTKVLKSNELARNKFVQLLNNHLEDAYDFDSLMMYLKKNGKTNLMNI